MSESVSNLKSELVNASDSLLHRLWKSGVRSKGGIVDVLQSNPEGRESLTIPNGMMGTLIPKEAMCVWQSTCWQSMELVLKGHVLTLMTVVRFARSPALGRFKKQIRFGRKRSQSLSIQSQSINSRLKSLPVVEWLSQCRFSTVVNTASGSTRKADLSCDSAYWTKWPDGMQWERSASSTTVS